MHVIEIIKHGYNPTERPEPIFWYQPSRGLGGPLAFKQFSLVYLNAHRCFVGFRASFMQTSQRLSSVFFLEVTAKACVGKSPHIDTVQSGSAFLGRRHAAWGKILLQHAACQSVTPKGTECKTVVRVQKH